MKIRDFKGMGFIILSDPDDRNVGPTIGVKSSKRITRLRIIAALRIHSKRLSIKTNIDRGKSLVFAIFVSIEIQI